MSRRLYLGPLTDNRRWDRVAIRPDDVIVATPPKSGTTWMQTMVALLYSGDPEVETELPIKMPWVDIRFRDVAEVAERLENMQHRRSMKSHTPMDGLPFHQKAQYICVFRHPLDAHFSFRRHVRNISMSVLDDWFPEGDPEGITFQRFLNGSADGKDCDAMPLAHIIQHYKAATALADRPNVSLFHYADMQRDLAGTFDRLSQLLGIFHPPEVMSKLIAAATFDNMKQNAARYAPGGGSGFYKSDADFFHSGSSQKWQDQLTRDEMAAYDAMMDANLSQKDRAWLERGSVGT